MALKHWAWTIEGDPTAIEETIARSVLTLRAGDVTAREIGGEASWTWEDCRFELEWLRLVEPRGVRVDLLVDLERCGWAESAIVEEVRRVVLQGEYPLQPTTQQEQAEVAPARDLVSAWSVAPVASADDSAARAGLVAGAIASSVGALASGSALWICRKRKNCLKRPVVVGALVASLLVGATCGAVLLLSRGTR